MKISKSIFTAGIAFSLLMMCSFCTTKFETESGDTGTDTDTDGVDGTEQDDVVSEDAAAEGDAPEDMVSEDVDVDVEEEEELPTYSFEVQTRKDYDYSTDAYQIDVSDSRISLELLLVDNLLIVFVAHKRINEEGDQFSHVRLKVFQIDSPGELPNAPFVEGDYFIDTVDREPITSSAVAVVNRDGSYVYFFQTLRDHGFSDAGNIRVLRYEVCGDMGNFSADPNEALIFTPDENIPEFHQINLVQEGDHYHITITKESGSTGSETYGITINDYFLSSLFTVGTGLDWDDNAALLFEGGFSQVTNIAKASGRTAVSRLMLSNDDPPLVSSSVFTFNGHFEPGILPDEEIAICVTPGCADEPPTVGMPILAVNTFPAEYMIVAWVTSPNSFDISGTSPGIDPPYNFQAGDLPLTGEISSDFTSEDQMDLFMPEDLRSGPPVESFKLFVHDSNLFFVWPSYSPPPHSTRVNFYPLSLDYRPLVDDPPDFIDTEMDHEYNRFYGYDAVLDEAGGFFYLAWQDWSWETGHSSGMIDVEGLVIQPARYVVEE